MNCTRDADRLAVHRSDSDITRVDVDTRSSSVNDDLLRDWLEERVRRGDIMHHETVNGIPVFRVLRPLYPECEFDDE